MNDLDEREQQVVPEDDDTTGTTASQQSADSTDVEFTAGGSFERAGEFILLTVVTAFFTYMWIDSLSWPERSTLVPRVTIVLALPFLLVRWYRVLRPGQPDTRTSRSKRGGSGQIMDTAFRSSGDVGEDARRFIRVCVLILSLIAGIWLVGVEIAAPLGVLIYLYFVADAGLTRSLIISAAILGLIVGFYNRVLNVPWPEPLLWRWLGGG